MPDLTTLIPDLAVRRDLRSRLDGRVAVTGPLLARRSCCLQCGLDSGPWRTRRAAETSGLLHLSRHHPGRP